MIARDKVSLPRFWRALAIAVIVLAGIAGVWLVGEHSPANLGRATLAIGGAGLVIGIGLILLALWRASRRPIVGPLAAAYLGSLMSLLVAYQATNALNFSLIWLIAGAGMAIAVRVSPDENRITEQVA